MMVNNHKKLLNARLARAEKMTLKQRKEFDVPDNGLVVIETWAEYTKEEVQNGKCLCESCSGGVKR